MKRKVCYDVMRIIAVLFVIFNHTEKTGFQYYAVTENEVMRYVYMSCAIVCKVAVFTFFIAVTKKNVILLGLGFIMSIILSIIMTDIEVKKTSNELVQT